MKKPPKPARHCAGAADQRHAGEQRPEDGAEEGQKAQVLWKDMG